MSRQSTRLISKLCLVAIVLTGCHPTQPFYFHEDGDLSHYVGRATQIEEPDVEVRSLADVEFAKPPLTLKNADFEDVWELTLDEAIQIALANSKVVRVVADIGLGRTDGRAPEPSTALLGTPEVIRTVLDPALQETSVGLAGLQIGPEAALAAFDADFTANMTWQKNDDPNNVGIVNLGRRLATVQDLATFQARIQKATAAGGLVQFGNVTRYDQNNTDTDFRPFPSEFRTEWTAEWRQALLQGRDVGYNEIAGPFHPNAGVGSRAFDGVLLARIDADRSLAQLERSIRDLVNDIGNGYWNLYCAYQLLEVEKQGLKRARDVWKKSKERDDPRYPATAEVDRAKEQYFSFLARVEQAKTDLLNWENRLRYLMGLSVGDGRLIRPADEPIRVDVVFNWHDVLDEALARSVELRRQRWQIERRELELIAAKNHLLPRLDMVARYRWQGFGDRLIDPGNGFNPSGNPATDAFRRRFDNAFGNLADGDFQEWELGLEFNIPIGMRQELADVRHRQLFVAKEKALLQEQELELTHFLADAIRGMDNWSRLIRTYFNQRQAAKNEYDKLKQRFDNTTGVSNFDLLNAQSRYLQAETQYWFAVCSYTRSIEAIHYRKGSLLEHHNVFLAEGPWPGKAYFDAVRLARQRDASIYLNYGTTQPGVLSRGPYAQHSAPHSPYGAVPAGAYESSEDAEELRLPEPEDSFDDRREPPEPEAPQPDLRFTQSAAQTQATFRRGTGPYAGQESVLASDSVENKPVAAAGPSPDDTEPFGRVAADSNFRR